MRNRNAIAATAILLASLPAPMLSSGGDFGAPSRHKARWRQPMTVRNERRLAKRRAMNKIAAKSRKVNRRHGR